MLENTFNSGPRGSIFLAYLEAPNSILVKRVELAYIILYIYIYRERERDHNTHTHVCIYI